MSKFLAPHRVAALGALAVTYAVCIAFADDRGLPWEHASLSHPLGRDEIGRDLFCTVFLSAVNSLINGAACAIAGLALATAPSFAIAFVRSTVLTAIIESVFRIVEGVPVVVWVLVFALVIPAAPRALGLAAFLIAVLPYLIRLLSGEFTRLSTTPYVEVARSQGLPARKLVVYHLLPNASPLVIPAMAQVTGLAVSIDGAIALIGAANRSDLTIGILLLRAKENLLGHPNMAFIAICATLATFATIWFVSSAVLRDSHVDTRLL